MKQFDCNIEVPNHGKMKAFIKIDQSVVDTVSKEVLINMVLQNIGEVITSELKVLEDK